MPISNSAFAVILASILMGCETTSHDAHASQHATGDTAHDAHAKSGVTADEALKRLMEGNERFVDGHRLARADEAHVRAELANTQKPFAIVVCCSDSRVGPEIVFDQGLGDIFVVRTAGEVVDDAALGSIEYGVEHLGAPLILVLGHERCGAVSAAVAGGEAHGHVAALVKAILPAVAETRGQAGDAVDNAVHANVRDVVRALRTSEPILAELAGRGAVTVRGARYLDTGRVEIEPMK
jgi:carbonic anhydrase